ncbi:MAG: ATP-binding protein, partial [Microbacterium sp.]
ERAAARLRETPWRVNARVSGPWLRQGPLALPPVVRRPLDAALHRGALTLRGYDRTLRLAWTIADLAGHAAPTVHDIGRALFMKKGIMQ